MLQELASLAKTQLYNLRLEIFLLSDAIWAALLPLKELPWGQVLIDGPPIHDAATAIPFCCGPGCVLLDHCHVESESSWDLTAFTEPYHHHTFASTQMRCAHVKQYKQLTHIQLQTHTLLITLNDMRHVSTGLCRGTSCGRVKASRTRVLPHQYQRKKQLTDVYQDWISVWCNKRTKCVILCPPPQSVN